MKLFYHHVGISGSKEDFKKTVFKPVDFSVLNTIPVSEPFHTDIVDTLQSAFPEGRFNCWGVPSGADIVIRNLQVGDAVLLVERAGEFGHIPALGIVKAFWKIQLRDLSRALWGEGKYPYVFFFHTHPIELSWPQFVEDVGFKPNFDPRGKFYSVATHRLESFGGPAGYINHIYRTCGKLGR